MQTPFRASFLKFTPDEQLEGGRNEWNIFVEGVVRFKYLQKRQL